MFKFISEDSVLLTYGKWHENDKLTFFFNKELEQVDIEYQIFERNADCHFVPQGENSHSCKYGYWRVEAPTLSMEDIEFLHNKTKELWGDHSTEKDGAEKHFFSPEEVRAMSRKEVRENYTAIVNSMKKW